jgi:hypothetical protein
MKAWLLLLLFGASLPGQRQSKLLLPDETAGFDRIVQTLVSAFDHVDIVALGENHGSKMDSDLRIAADRRLNRGFAPRESESSGILARNPCAVWRDQNRANL